MNMLTDNELKKDLRFRTKLISAIVIILSGVLLFNLCRLQIYYAEKYSLLSDKNRIRLLSILPKRGSIVTSDGNIIAGGIYKYRLIIDYCDKKTFQENVSAVGACLGFTDQEIQRILNLRKKSISRVIIKDALSWDEYAKISMILFRLSNVSIEHIYVREYLSPLEFSHITGYIAKSDDGIQISNGKTGIEAFCNGQLRGIIGNIQTEINSIGKKIRTLSKTDSISGNDVTVTIDAHLQKYVYDLISEQKAGACVILDTINSEILAMVSVPGFDSNLLSNGMSREQWKNISSDSLFPLMNRAVSCSYPPGSIFKIVIAFAALSEGLISPNDKIFCSGGIAQDDRVFHCWNRHGHGSVNMYTALSLSCDCYFFEIAKRLGIDKIVKYAEKFGFGSEVGVELLSENAGLLPTKRWKFLKYGTSWKIYETMIAGIGQGALLATLLQSATMMGKLYTNDYSFVPTLIKNGKKIVPIDQINPKYAEIIKKALYMVCTSGTAAGSCRTDYGISGKTGSSQVRKIKSEDVGRNQQNMEWKYRDHAFFVGIAPYKNPRYVIAVFIEHGGGGASVAAPIARRIFDKLLGRAI
jgi:penicillin-binding protein 2